MINEVNLLEYSKKEYERISDKAYKSDHSEVEYRNCARVAYYSLYHLLKDIADSLPGSYEDNIGSHEKVIRRLMSFGNDNQKLFAEKLKNQRTIRVHADYKLGNSFNKSDVYKSLRYAESVFTLVAESGGSATG